MTLHIRRATIDDAEAISTLVHSVAHYFTVHADGRGAEEFFKSITPDAVRSYLASDQYVYWVGCLEQQQGQMPALAPTLATAPDHIIAAIALRDNSHLYHLFVTSDQQSKGYAKQLWEELQLHATQRGNPGNFTVNASLFAEKMYRKWGFTPTTEVQEMHGLRFIPMQKNITSNAT
ncbi:GNAT family N-acetyltransferase [Undibacterium danionis]|uniref:GNAT family N-acetyltransferase n=1 Tax=Undibacterium danionis TaxID=1812100 RepID=A0ABV6IFX4_9BURK